MKLTGKKSFCKEADNFFPSGKKQLFALKLSKRNQFKHLVVSSREKTHPAAARAVQFAYVAMGEIFIVSTVFFFYQIFPQTTAKSRIM